MNRDNLCFDFCNTLINQYDINEIASILPIIFHKLIEFQTIREQDKSINKLRDFKRNFLFLSSMIILKYNFEALLFLFKNDLNGCLNFYQTQYNSINDIDSFEDKRLVVYAYSNTIQKILNNVDNQIIFACLKQMLNSIFTFYKYSSYYSSKESPIETKDEYAFIKDSTHILVQAKIQLNDLDLFKAIKKQNETMIYFNLLDICYNVLGINSVNIFNDNEQSILEKLKTRLQVN